MFYIAAAGLATLIGVLGGRVKPMSGFFFWLKYYEYVFLYFMVVSAVTTKEEARGLVFASLSPVSWYRSSQLRRFPAASGRPLRSRERRESPTPWAGILFSCWRSSSDCC